MSRERFLGLILGFLSMAAAALAAPGAARAQGLPPGSYVHTCSGVKLVSNVLEATCQKANGTFQDAALPNPGACKYGVANLDGNLACADAPQLTSETTTGQTNLHNACPAPQEAIFVIRPSPSAVVMAIFLEPGQSLKINVLAGASYVAGCGKAPADLTHFQYFNVTPVQ